MSELLVEGARCPADGCHWPVVECDCNDTDLAERRGGFHLICLGCGQDVEQDEPDASGPCDCGPDCQPDPDDDVFMP